MRLPLICAVLMFPLFADDETSFDTAAPAEWSRHNPLSAVGASATFTFDGATCRISAPAPAPEVYPLVGGARAGLFAPEIFTDCVASVDLTDWIPTTNRNNDGTFVGVFTRVQPLGGPDGVAGYSASILDLGPGSDPNSQTGGRLGRLQVNGVIENQGVFVSLDGYDDFELDPARDYRLVLSSIGSVHTARVYDLSQPGAPPVAQRIGTNALFTSGRTGMMILTDRLAPAEATFDNFLAWDGTPPALAIGPGSQAGTVELSCDFHRSLAGDLQTATALEAPGDWTLAAPVPASLAGGRLVRVFPLDAPRRFFRLKGP